MGDGTGTDQDNLADGDRVSGSVKGIRVRVAVKGRKQFG